jgi:hypothetical protein
VSLVTGGLPVPQSGRPLPIKFLPHWAILRV